MKKSKIAQILPGKQGYQWQYCSLGGVTRVNIATGEDVAHLGELDRKLWTVLSCPVKGLEIDGRTLQLLDRDGDGKIRVDEIIDAAQWITSILVNKDDILKGADTLRLEQLNGGAEAQTIVAASRTILEELGRTNDQISFADIAEYKELTDKKYAAESGASVEVDMRPYGDDTAAVTDAVDALRDKVADFFMRCQLVRFDADCQAAVDVSVDRIASIATGDVAKQAADIATYPLARPNADGLLQLDNINPAWMAQMNVIKQKALAEGTATIDATQWQAIISKVDEYKAYLVKEADGHVALVSEAHKAANDRYALIERTLHLYRDFYTLLRNYVFFHDFYKRDNNTRAIFQNGRLFIDQRCCELCMRVDSIDGHAALATASGMYLIYCTCTSKVKNETINIVAVLTDGDIDNLAVGKNAVYYDRNGLDWDATVTKIVDNPISIRQAFWSPYRKFWNWCTEKLTKSAAEKEDKAFNDLTAKADEASTKVTTAPAEGEAAPAEAKKAPFDIAKFAGIFAAIGMAVGYIASAAAGLTKTIGENPWNLLILIAGIIIVISGPSMFIAWTKLRKRNLGPMLNANGWAINAVVLVNVRFGATLTSIAKYPKIVTNDPFAKKKLPLWARLLIWLGVIILVAAAVYAIIYFCR